MHDFNNSITGVIPPSAVTPQFVGQVYIDTLSGCTYISKSLVAGDWVRSIRSEETIQASYFSDWTWQNQGSATLTDGELGIPSLYVPTTAPADNIRHLVKAVPSSSYQLTAKLSFTGPKANYYQAFIGWKAATGAAAKLELLAIKAENIGVVPISRFHWTNETTYSAATNLAERLQQNNFYFRIKETGGNIYLYYSTMGSSWKLLETYAKGAKFLGVGDYNYLVIGGNTVNSSKPCYIDIHYCKLENI
jgi:hypothetical protein